MALDVETVLDSIETFLKANLNTQIAAMNTEKGGSIVLATVANDAYIFQSMNNEAANFNPYVFFGVESPSTDSIGPSTAKRYTAIAIIVLSDDGNDTDVGRRVLRYGRVLEDLFNANYNSVQKELKFVVRSLEPITFQLINSNDNYRAVGVELGFDFA